MDVDDPEVTTSRRRITRQSTRRVTVDSNTNPYKKPTYTPGSNGGNGGSDSSNDSTSGRGKGKGTPVTPSRGRGRGRGASSANGTKTPVSSSGSGSKGTTPRGAKRGSASRRPECISSSRTNKGRQKGKKKKRRSYYNTSDYHYGSDFDEDEEEDEDEDREEDDDEDDDAGESPSPSPSLDLDLDNETSDSTPDLGVPPPPLYIECEPTVNLILPKSSDDLLISKDYVVEAVAVYEPLRRFSGLVRLTQFRFEDFCAALAGEEEQSVLLAEIHVQLLKALLREDDLLSTSFGPPEVKDSIQSILYFIDAVTYPQVLRLYLECDPAFSAPSNLIKNLDYPFCSIAIRLQILTFLVNQFIATTPVRDALASEVIRHEDHCRSCTRLGELICCESCPAVYHLECIDPPLKKDGESGEVPDEWKCIVCKKDELTGTADCVSELERAGLLIRHEKLGYDRHGRKYWFIVRRIIVEEESSCWYYSTKQQLAELIYCLEGESYEENLLQALRYHQDEIERQMDITEQLTIAAGAHRRTWLDIENAALTKLNEERAAIIEHEKAERIRELEEEAERVAKLEEERLRVEEESKRKEEDEKRRIREERLAKRNTEKAKQFEEADLALINDLIRETEKADAEKAEMEANAEIKEGETPMETEVRSDETELGATKAKEEAKGKEESDPAEPPIKPFKKPTSKLTLTTLVDTDVERMTRLKSHPPFKLGMDGVHKTFVNAYSTDPLALSKQQHQEERDRKRYTSHKFSLTTASEFKWMGSSYGGKNQLAGSIKGTLLTLEALLPTTLLHINWAGLRKTWLIEVQSGANIQQKLIELVYALRPCLFNPVWLDGVGHLKLVRMSALERDERKKIEKFEKKWRDDEEERLKMIGFVHHTIPVKHQIHKQRGEEYRLHGQYGWVWRSTLRPAKSRPSGSLGLKGGPQKHIIQVKGEDGVVKTMLIDPNVYNKLMAKRVPGEPPGIKYEKVKLNDGRTIEWREYIEGVEEEDVEDEIDELMDDMLEKLELNLIKIEDSLNEDNQIELKVKQEESDPDSVINVSQGLVLCNRIQYPKLAYRASACDNLIARRTKLQQIEEKLLQRKYGQDYTDNEPEDTLSCYSYDCTNRGTGTCYSPTCSRARSEMLRTKINKERIYSRENTAEKVYLKKSAAEIKVKKSKPSSTFKASRGHSVLILPTWELRKLARSGGRVFIPAGFNGLKPWGNYPCSRPNFKTTWTYRTVVGGWSLSCIALQLRILWACIRWDDLHMKPPLEGKSQVTTDTEIITNEILNHRITGRFMERVQYLRKRHIVPIDTAPVKTIVDKGMDSVTPSRHGLRKRKRLQTPPESDPTILEEWVDEEKLELWEIRYYGERKLNERNTRLRTGVQLSKPDKWDPNSTPPQAEPRTNKRLSDASQSGGKKIDPALIAEHIDSKVAHISKRDNHAKIQSPAPIKTEPTASELLQQQMQQNTAQKTAISSTPTGAPATAARKFFMSKAKENAEAKAKETEAKIAETIQRVMVPLPPSTSIPPVVTPTVDSQVAQTEQTPRLQVFKSPDGRLQIRGLLPGQHCYQTADGRIHIVGTGGAARAIRPPRMQTQVPQITQQNSPVRTYTTPRQQQPRAVQGQVVRVAPPRVLSTSDQPQSGIAPTPQHVFIRVPQQQVQGVQTQSNSPQLLSTSKPQQMFLSSTPTNQQVLITSTPSTQQQVLISSPPTTNQQQIFLTSTPTNPQQVLLSTSNPQLQGQQIFLRTSNQQQLLISRPRQINPRAPRGVQPQFVAVTNQLPISIVSPSKQQQPLLQLITTADGQQYLTKQPIIRRVLQTGGVQPDTNRIVQTGQPISLQPSQPVAGASRFLIRTTGQQSQPFIFRTAGNGQQPPTLVKLTPAQMSQMMAQPGQIRVQASQTQSQQPVATKTMQSTEVLSTASLTDQQPKQLSTTSVEDKQPTSATPTQMVQVQVASTTPSEVQVALPSSSMPQIIKTQPTVRTVLNPTNQPGLRLVNQFQLAELQKQGLLKTVPPSYIIRGGQQQLQQQTPLLLKAQVAAPSVMQQQVAANESSGQPVKVNITTGFEGIPNIPNISGQAISTPSIITASNQQSMQATQITVSAPNITLPEPAPPLIQLPPLPKTPPRSPTKKMRPASPRLVTPPPRLLTPPPVIAGLDTPVEIVPKASVSPAKSVGTMPSPTKPNTILNAPVPTGIQSFPSPTMNLCIETVAPATLASSLEVSPTKPFIVAAKKSSPVLPTTISSTVGEVAPTTPSPVISAPAVPPPSVPLPVPTAKSPPNIPLAPLPHNQLKVTPKISRRKTNHAQTSKPEELLNLQQKQLLFNHKEDLKEDIMRKRGLLEAQIQAEIQREIRVEQELKRKSEELAEAPHSKRRKSSPRQERPTCVCNQPIIGTQFYVGCPGCNNFFHGACVGITKQMLNEGKSYTCSKCRDMGSEEEFPEEAPFKEEIVAEKKGPGRRGRKKGGKNKEIYCLCKEPYDDSHFYIGCDMCEDWFHGRCVGVLPLEGNKISDYKCPQCSPKSAFNTANFRKLLPRDHEYLKRLMQEILELEEADEFYDEVDPRLHPNYRKIIREPMELRTMEQRVSQNLYTRLSDFVADACRIFDNCKHYNPSTSPICKKAVMIETFLVSKLRILRQKMLSHGSD